MIFPTNDVGTLSCPPQQLSTQRSSWACSFVLSNFPAPPSPSITLTIFPPNMAVARAAIGRIMANGNPINENVAMIESTPVCGVAIRKETAAPLLAPSRRNDIAVGRTPHEQSGRGMPKSAASTTLLIFGLARYLL